MFGPVIRGKSVVLRPPRPEDVPSYVAWFADPDVGRYISQGPLSLEVLQPWVERVEKKEDSVLWSLETPADPPDLIGFTMISELDQTSRWGETSTIIGEKNHWRKGIATEVALLRTQYAFSVLGLNKLKATVFVGNEGSYRALLKAGYQQVGLWRQELFRSGQWHDKRIMEVLRQDW